jgi:hypothetical protein
MIRQSDPMLRCVDVKHQPRRAEEDEEEDEEESRALNQSH